MPKIYLDYLTATPLHPEVRAAMAPYLEERFGSPAALNLYGMQARDALKEAREKLATFINAPSPDDLICTSDGTEAMNLAVKGVAWANRSRGCHIVMSAIEHPGIDRSAEFLAGQGFEITRLPVDEVGRIDPAVVAAALRDDTILVATHIANHDLATLQPVREIGELVAARGIPFYVDAEAATGWLPVDVRELRASLLSFSPARFYGPKGVGVLYRSGRVPLTSLIHGGEQEHGHRAGNENISAIVGAGVAAELATAAMVDRGDRLSALQQQLWQGIAAAIPDVRLNGPPPDGGRRRSLHALNISFAGVEGEGVALAADLKGLVIASGPACRGKAVKVSPTLQAIGVPDDLARATVLLSLGNETTPGEIDAATDILAKVVERLRSLN